MNFFDTAEIYGPYENEVLVGRVLSAVRDNVIIATKFGVSPLAGRTQSGTRSMDSRPETVMASCDASLKRLGTDYIDLYYQHRLDPDVPIEETVGALKELISAGKVRYIGLSEVDGDTLRRASAVHPITAVQSEWSLWTRDVETGILPVMEELGVGFVAYSPLGRGFLTGQIKSVDDLGSEDWRRTSARFAEGNFDKNLRLVEAVRNIAAGKGATYGQIALAWLLAKSPNVVPIPGTTRPDRLSENVGACAIALTSSEMQALDDIFSADAVSGERYGRA